MCVCLSLTFTVESQEPPGRLLGHPLQDVVYTHTHTLRSHTHTHTDCLPEYLIAFFLFSSSVSLRGKMSDRGGNRRSLAESPHQQAWSLSSGVSPPRVWPAILCLETSNLIRLNQKRRSTYAWLFCRSTGEQCWVSGAPGAAASRARGPGRNTRRPGSPGAHSPGDAAAETGRYTHTHTHMQTHTHTHTHTHRHRRHMHAHTHTHRHTHTHTQEAHTIASGCVHVTCYQNTIVYWYH